MCDADAHLQRVNHSELLANHLILISDAVRFSGYTVKVEYHDVRTFMDFWRFQSSNLPSNYSRHREHARTHASHTLAGRTPHLHKLIAPMLASIGSWMCSVVAARAATKASVHMA